MLTISFHLADGREIIIDQTHTDMTEATKAALFLANRATMHVASFGARPESVKVRKDGKLMFAIYV